jgi:hypothetical protein
MLYIDGLGKYYYCPLKRNRLVDDTEKKEDYKRIGSIPILQKEGEKGRKFAMTTREE